MSSNVLRLKAREVRSKGEYRRAPNLFVNIFVTSRDRDHPTWTIRGTRHYRVFDHLQWMRTVSRVLAHGSPFESFVVLHFTIICTL